MTGVQDVVSRNVKASNKRYAFLTNGFILNAVFLIQTKISVFL